MIAEKDIVIRLDAYMDTKVLGMYSLSKHGIDRFSALLGIQEAVECIFDAKKQDHVDMIAGAFGEGPLIVVSSNYFYDVYEKLELLKETFGLNVLFIDRVAVPIFDAQTGMLRANILDAINYIRHRRQTDNILYFSVNPLWRLVILHLLRAAFPTLKIMLYIYDWITLFCPYERRSTLQEFLKLPLDYVESEYKVFDLIMKGAIVDGLLYKDGGEDFPALRDYPGPKLYFPAFLSEKLYQMPVADGGGRRRFVYFGKLFSPKEYVRELFTDAFLFDIFKSLAEQDFTVDIYYMRSTQQTIQEYLQHLSGVGTVRLIEGSPLKELLPRVSGMYDWGCLINQYSNDYSVIRKHVEAALPARIFTFMALGLPVALSEELTYSAQFVKSHGIGVVVPQHEIMNLNRILLKESDYSALRRNVLAVREQYSLERQEGSFLAFVGDILGERVSA